MEASHRFFTFDVYLVLAFRLLSLFRWVSAFLTLLLRLLLGCLPFFRCRPLDCFALVLAMLGLIAMIPSGAERVCHHPVPGCRLVSASNAFLVAVEMIVDQRVRCRDLLGSVSGDRFMTT